MRNAVIRKKRIKVERAYLDFISRPIRHMSGVVHIEGASVVDYDSFINRARIMAMYT
ncbi:hypothetical protein SAMN04487917_101357 [Arthrobacter sp. yr096]|uniref:hypothetical protein n=1 Tax=Arthrobacter sp. yr096 TaxID=1761750 RepID=UPI0008CCEC49|nr:hypothetical protein [Arthrobacter sp. yr096]SEI45034.1 hypothetical protein SAMN04487917_101357 [Arthrobacter sp. yr096]